MGVDKMRVGGEVDWCGEVVWIDGVGVWTCS